MALAARTATASAASVWPPSRIFDQKPGDLPPSQFDRLAQLLPITLVDRDILFVTSAHTLTINDPQADVSEPSVVDRPQMWDRSTIGAMLRSLKRKPFAETGVLVVITGRSGQQILQTSTPFLGWGVDGHCCSTSVRSMLLLDVHDGHETTCTPLMRSHTDPERTTFDGTMDVILPSSSFVAGLRPDALAALFGAPKERTHHLRADNSGCVA